MDTDSQHLKLLEIFHYVVGAMIALFACIPLIYVALGLAMVCGAFDGKDAPPAALGWLFVCIPAFLCLCGWALAACLALAGQMIRQRKAWTFCLGVACAACLAVPYGTLLGVFTIIVLMRDSVRTAFGADRSSPSA